jgi:hypothetical protein
MMDKPDYVVVASSDLTSYKRTIESKTLKHYCFKCLVELRNGDEVYWCEIEKKIYCTKAICKRLACAAHHEHEDWYGTLRVTK